MTTSVSMRMLSMRQDYVVLVQSIRRNGERVRVRDQDTFELFDATLIFDHLYLQKPMLPVGVGRNVNTKLAAVEALALLAGTGERDLIMKAAPSYAKVLVSQAEHDFYYAAYGPRLSGTVDSVIHQLVTDPSTRQAVLSIWRRDDLYHAGDKPCTLTIQFLIRDDRLHMVVNMRSNDVWRGLAYDAFVFSQLHWTVLGQLARHLPDVKIGEYRHHAASLHLYARDVEAADKLHVGTGNGDLEGTTPLPLGLQCPIGYFPDQVAEALLHPPYEQPADYEGIARFNPWYAAQLDALDRQEVRR